MTLDDEEDVRWEYQAILECRQRVLDGRVVPRFLWRWLLPGDLVSLSTVNGGPRLVVSSAFEDGIGKPTITGKLLALAPHMQLETYVLSENDSRNVIDW